jgi:16S rRNA processing protein RimM
MLDTKDLLPVGVFSRTHGIGGELVLRLQAWEAEEFPEMEWVFVEIDGLPVPFFIAHVRDLRGDKMILQLKTVTSESRARELTGCRLYIPGKKRTGKKLPEDRFTDIKGYRVKDESLGDLGIADEVIAIAGNPLLRVISGEREFLIPLHPDIILEISDRKKIIRIQAPEGLTEL